MEGTTVPESVVIPDPPTGVGLPTALTFDEFTAGGMFQQDAPNYLAFMPGASMSMVNEDDSSLIAIECNTEETIKQCTQNFSTPRMKRKRKSADMQETSSKIIDMAMVEHQLKVKLYELQISNALAQRRNDDRKMEMAEELHLAKIKKISS